MARICQVCVLVIVVASLIAGGCTSPPPSPTATPVAQATEVSPPPSPTATPEPPTATPVPPTPTQQPPTATPLPPTATPVLERRAQVDALWFSFRGGEASGGTSTVKVLVEKNTSDQLRVGFFEEEVGGSGPMWRAAGWMATILSSFLLGVDPMDYRFTYDVGGYIDGPSAGALMTVATLACLLGDDVRSDAAMTGTINPDGTIGPVGGIPQKLDGAAASGKKLVLIPAGQRNSLDYKTGSYVDVIERGRRLQVQVKEVSDIYEAYELLTDRPLPRPHLARDTRPELPGTSYDRVKAKAKEWYTRYWSVRSQYNALPTDARFDFTDELIWHADDLGSKADSYYSQGLATGAYGQAIGAALNASIAFHAAKVIEAYVLGGGEESALNYVDSLSSVSLKLDAILDRLQTQPARTLGDVVAISDAYGQVTMAMGLVEMAESAIYDEFYYAQEDADAAAALAKAALYYALADHVLELAEDATEMGMGYGDLPAPSEDKVRSMSELLRRAAEANINYFESVVLEDVARGAGVHPDVVRSAFANQDFDYTFAMSSLRALPYIQEKAGPGTAGLYATLGGAINSYGLSSTLVAKYYSLGAQVDAEGNIIGVQNERAMIDMLDFAERRSRENISVITALKVDPVQPIVHYESAKIDREGSIEDKLNALKGFWTSSMQGQILITLSGQARLVD